VHSSSKSKKVKNPFGSSGKKRYSDVLTEENLSRDPSKNSFELSKSQAIDSQEL